MRRRRGPAVRLHAIIGHPVVASSLLPSGVHLVGFREISGVTTYLPVGTRGPVSPDAAAHGAIVSALFAQQSIVPLPPGVVFRRSETLADWLELHYAALHDALGYVEGRAEARVHISPSDATGAGTPRRLSDGGPASPPSFSASAVNICHEVGREAAAWMLLPRSAEARLAGGTSADAGSSVAYGGRSYLAGSTGDGVHAHGRDVADVSASFLVDRSHWREFADAVAAEVGRQPALEIRLTGPWPPYDFVRLQFGG
jgi:hypothetical protein